MTATLFQASKAGNVELVRSLLDESSVDIDARDDAGLTALHHAVRANHLDVVSQLLAKGANAAEVAQETALKHNPELAAIVNNAVHHTQSAAFQSAPVVDSHGGKQLPDGTVSYVQPPAHQEHAVDASMQQQHFMHHSMSQPIYPFQPQNNFFDPSHNPEHRAHAPKEGSSGSLPPPEVARFIPCRFYPNCRYADKCIFAHPVAVPASGPAGSPLSPGQAPMFYQSHAYAYPSYGPPQHFYTMAPPMPIQYTHAGVPMPVHMPPPHHMAPVPLSVDQTDAYGQPYPSQSHQPAASDAAQGAESDSVDDRASQANAAESVAAAPSESEPEKGLPAAGSATSSAAASFVPTTSFSAFMAHHAAPFQPGPGAQNGVTVGADGSILTGSQSFPRGTKGARRSGASMNGSFGSRSEFGKRSNERPACSFFARSACKHGEDCRFPHILPDGTDARGPNAGRSTHSIEASRAISRALAAKTARASINGLPANNSNAAQPSQSAIPGDSSSLPPSSTNVTAFTSPASAQTTISSAQETEDIAKALTDKAVPRGEATEKPASTASTSTPATTASAGKKEQSATPKSSVAAGAASSSAARAVSSASKADTKTENANGKRASVASRTDEAKSASALAGGSNGDRIPASIPSKPLVNGNGNATATNRQSGTKPQANGVHAAKGQQTQNSTRSRSHQGNAGRTHGQGGQNGAGQKKLAPQRLPNADDFPALSNGHGTIAAASAPSINANGVTRANFSAILSAPAPVKKQPEPVKESEPAAADKGSATAASTTNGEAKDATAAIPDTEPKSSATKQTTANGLAAPMLDFAAVVQSNPVAV